MKRFIIMMVGKTHSGKTSFAKELENSLEQAVMIDQDTHAFFLQNHYPKLIPKTGSNDLKHAITQTIVDYTVNETDAHLILSNANLERSSRTRLLNYYQEREFTSIIVYFDLPETLLRERIARGNRDAVILRTVSSFEQVLDRQMRLGKAEEPSADEADHLLVIRDVNDLGYIMVKILNTVQN
ncbi:CRISPR-associated protein Cas2 [Terribacillus saccharophilus]|jgi:predicted kinase|uniref:CRISPR-associated protein Cas2 n=1 Tax=Terribacillus saccharophilus TaxID=361277 RepID=A0A268H8Z7_9BACI|nr:ATP-binding protein [Terribacillus saccharophilus]PAE06355.1 CRISPR-associated protein Cas2 [Terribacillus saccharophilus]